MTTVMTRSRTSIFYSCLHIIIIIIIIIIVITIVFPEKAEKTSILSIVSWLLLLTFAPAADLAVAVPLRPL